MNAAIGWSLAVLAVAVGFVGYGWRGVVLALTVVVFWLLLQFSRALRVLRQAAARPVGSVPNAVMFHARLQRGQSMQQLLLLSRSLGRKLGDEPEVFAWRDEAGDEVRVELAHGRVSTWQLQRAAQDPPAA